MSERRDRLRLIAESITGGDIRSQLELTDILSRRGIAVTQATISRDLKALGVSRQKTDDCEGYRYVIRSSAQVPVQDKATGTAVSTRKSGAVAQGMTLKFSRNIAVIKTRNGYASALAYDLDMSGMEQILGTIAGADTVFAILAEGVSHRKAEQLLLPFLERE